MGGLGTQRGGYTMSITTRPFKDYEAGLNVFPLRDEEKAPAVAELAPLLQRRADEAQVKQWFARGNTNYGIACGPVSGGLWVYDFERYEDAVELFGVRGLAELSAYTRVVKTPTEGYTYTGTVSMCPDAQPKYSRIDQSTSSVKAATCAAQGHG
ncbi:hypothetical protein B9Q03_09645 [Candidatus Marsarchaeota G2 archaeon OSP_D]|jgi:Bifunctional DNA primase/polymerase, N-terminal.|uniref:DNA primase/polymerase bifunctional N-terminal domain-containing protein n=1 Tax=Candidatus Marsarchaeota G2 archaeon OSP_D TaxID=1978157 RepID=A0A2R6ANZ7_9ARCH|nr:MAG: hypothetical protein B9Q03_09645 [Candidatus Marsarchaeota G2 archaeon OSP_D]